MKIALLSPNGEKKCRDLTLRFQRCWKEKCQEEIRCCFSASEILPSWLLWEIWSWDSILIFILYMCLMCCTHLSGLISCCRCPCTDVETEAQPGPCFPMLLAELGLALLHSGQGHDCGDPSYLPHHFLLPQKYYAGSFMPPCLGSRSSCSWKRPSNTYFLLLLAGAQPSGHSLGLLTSPSRLEWPWVAMSCLWPFPYYSVTCFSLPYSINPLGFVSPAINVNYYQMLTHPWKIFSVTSALI